MQRELQALAGRLQLAIESLYRVEAPVRVGEFCIGSTQLQKMLGRQPTRGMREALLVANDGEDFLLSLYLDDEVVSHATRFERGEGQPSGADAYCAVLEGVSHFVYFTFCSATHERPVSQLELELQAEVDKYLLLRLGAPEPRLIERLFHNYQLGAHLNAEERLRYHEASGRALRYARWVDRELVSGSAEHAIRDARELYRKPLEMKLDHIARAA